MSVTWGLAAEFRQLLERRDLAAYRAAAAIDLVIHFWEAQEYDAAFVSLKRASDDFRAAEERVENFLKTNKEKNNGNRAESAA